MNVTVRTKVENTDGEVSDQADGEKLDGQPDCDKFLARSIPALCT